MPTVPRVSGPTVEQAALPDARVNVRADADTFGAGAWDAVNRGATQIMRQQVAAAERERDKVDMAQVSAARTELANWEVDWFDPNNQKGVLAYQGKDALGLSSVMQQSYRDKVASLSQGLSSPEQKRAFEQMAAGYGVEVNGRVNRYALGESQKFQQQAFNAGMKSSSAIAADAARDGDMDRARKEMEYAGVLIDENARLTGEPPELVAERKRQLLSQTNAAGVSGMVSAGRQQEAEDYWRANQDDMIEADRLSAAKSIVMGRIQMDPQAASYALSASVPRQAGASVAGLPATPIAQIRTDAAAAGVPADEALAIAHIESGINPGARNPNSSAAGLFQLLDSSRQQYAGSPDVGDVAAQSKAGIAYIADSRRALTATLGRAPQPHEVYMAHLFGQAGAQAVLKSPDDRPILDVVRSYDPRNARDIVANNGMAGMTVGQVKAKWQSKMGAALATVSSIPTEAPTEAQPGAEPPRQDDSIVASLPIETRIQLQSAAESQARQAQGAARADLQVKVQDALAAFGRGESPPRLLQYADFEQAYGPMQAAREYESYRGWQQYGSDVGQLKTMPAQDMGRYLEQRRPVPGSEGYADATKRFDSLVQAAAHVQKARQEDPIAAALTAGGTAVTPLDMNNPQSLPDQLALRVAGAQQVSATYGTPLQVFSKDEAKTLLTNMDRMTPQEKIPFLRSMKQGMVDPRAFSVAMGQIAPDQPVLAIAGKILQKQDAIYEPGSFSLYSPNAYKANLSNREDVAALMIKGDALLNPQASDRKEDGKSKPFPMPAGADERGMRDSFNAYAGEAFAGLPGGYQLTYQAARAYYAGAMADRGDYSGEYSAEVWERAIKAATGGITNYQDRGQVVLPYGMPEHEFDTQAQNAFSRTLTARGMKPDELRNYGLKTQSEGRYIVTSGGSALFDPQGNKVVIDLSENGP